MSRASICRSRRAQYSCSAGFDGKCCESVVYEPLADEAPPLAIAVLPLPALFHCVAVGCGVNSRNRSGLLALRGELSSTAAVSRLILSRSCWFQGLIKPLKAVRL